MSLDATRWAWMQTVRPTAKLVLLSLADRAGPDHTAWPCYEQLVADTGLDRKTVWGAIKSLSEAGLIQDTGGRTGATKQIPVFKLVGVEGREKRNGSENGTVPKTPRNSSENGIRNLPEPTTKTKSTPKCYAFDGSTIKLTGADFENLRGIYPLLNLHEELAQLDIELQGKRKWWGEMNAKLNYRNKNSGAANAKNRPGSGAAANRSAAGRISENARLEREALGIARPDDPPVGADGPYVRAQVVERVRR